jgi:hypothetical protein
VAEAVRHEDTYKIRVARDCPSVPADFLTGLRNTDPADLNLLATIARRHPGKDRSSDAGGRMDVVEVRLSNDGAKAAPQAPRGREAVAERLLQVDDSGTSVESHDIHAAALVVLGRPQQDFAPTGMLDQVGRRLRDHDRDPADVVFGEPYSPSEIARRSPNVADMATIEDRNGLFPGYFHRATVN